MYLEVRPVPVPQNVLYVLIFHETFESVNGENYSWR